MMPMHHRARSIPAIRRFTGFIVASVAAAVLTVTPLSLNGAHAGDVPTFAVDASWPKPLPNNWIMGQVGGITADEQGHIWVFQRPRSLTDDEKAAALDPPRTKCCVPAPPVLEFDTDGNLLRSWGGPGEGYQWFGNEHGIEVTRRICLADRQCQRRQPDPEVHARRQIRAADRQDRTAPRAATTPRSSAGPPRSPSTRTPTKSTSPTATATGASSCSTPHQAPTSGTGAPTASRLNDDKTPPYDPKAPVSQQFGNPVHCVKIANDGLVYVCDRTNNRIQVFKKDGTFVKEWFYEKNTLANGAVWDVAIWPDPKQT